MPADNAAADILNRIIAALMSGGVAAAEAELAVLAPGLQEVPIVGWLVDEGIAYVAQILSIAGQRFVDNLVTDIQTNGERSAVITAGSALAFAIASGDREVINAATQDMANAYAAAIHFDGFGTPR